MKKIFILSLFVLSTVVAPAAFASEELWNAANAQDWGKVENLIRTSERINPLYFKENEHVIGVLMRNQQWDLVRLILKSKNALNSDFVYAHLARRQKFDLLNEVFPLNIAPELIGRSVLRQITQKMVKLPGWRDSVSSLCSYLVWRYPNLTFNLENEAEARDAGDQIFWTLAKSNLFGVLFERLLTAFENRGHRINPLFAPQGEKSTLILLACAGEWDLATRLIGGERLEEIPSEVLWAAATASRWPIVESIIESYPATIAKLDGQGLFSAFMSTLATGQRWNSIARVAQMNLGVAPKGEVLSLAVSHEEWRLVRDFLLRFPSTKVKERSWFAYALSRRNTVPIQLVKLALMQELAGVAPHIGLEVAARKRKGARDEVSEAVEKIFSTMFGTTVATSDLGNLPRDMKVLVATWAVRALDNELCATPDAIIARALTKDEREMLETSLGFAAQVVAAQTTLERFPEFQRAAKSDLASVTSPANIRTIRKVIERALWRIYHDLAFPERLGLVGDLLEQLPLTEELRARLVATLVRLPSLDEAGINRALSEEISRFVSETFAARKAAREGVLRPRVEVIEDEIDEAPVPNVHKRDRDDGSYGEREGEQAGAIMKAMKPSMGDLN